jgi:hypothetical protein
LTPTRSLWPRRLLIWLLRRVFRVWTPSLRLVFLGFWLRFVPHD